VAAGDLLGTAVSGLMAFQRQLATTGHNISNVNTPGFSRQNVQLDARLPQFSGDGFIGNGVQITTVKRSYDDFLTSQVRTSTSANSQLQQFVQSASQVDNLLSDPRAGLAPSLQSFFDAVQSLANDPSSTTGRQILLSQANALADRFHYLDARLTDLRNGVNISINTAVSEINNLANSIATVNDQIVKASSNASGQLPNDLLDKRDQLIAQLAERVSVSTVPQDNGALNVFIGNGQTLVIGGTANTLAVVTNQYDATRFEIGYQMGGATSNISSSITGGTLGGTLDFRNQILDTTQNALGRVAIGISATFNDQHQLGVDVNGALGGNFFNPIDTTSSTSRVLTASAAVVSVSVSNASALTSSDYRLDFNAGTYTLTRVSDGVVVYPANAAFPAGPIDGLTFTLAGLPTPQPVAGDSFLIQPTRLGAKDIGVVLTDPARIAAAGPLRTGAATNGSGLPTNLGTGTISAGTVSNTTGLPLAAPATITLTFNSVTNLFAVVGGPGGTIAYNPTTEGAGKTFTFAGFGGITFTMAGTPQNGDSFVISNNTNAIGDNRNALALGDLRNALTLANSTATYGHAYGQVVADVGTNTHRAQVNQNAQESVLKQATEARDSVAGVNLDEEAANMVRFQQAYQAAAQMIAVSNSVFQTMLDAVRG
jgi:flagellar hook-associated protein 1 FlgK